MKVSELREFLNNLSHKHDNDVVVIDDHVVIGVELQKGRVKDGYSNDYFTPHENGKKTALRFQKRREISTGNMITDLY